MRHEYLATRPLDIYGMHLFELVATLGGFTRAAEAAGMSQSAVTRQIQALEEKLGALLFERTTRKTVLTNAGRTLLVTVKKVTGDLDDALKSFREQHLDAPKVVRVGFSRSIGLASLPGFIAPFHRHSPGVRLQVSHANSMELTTMLLDRQLDVAVVSSPSRLNPALQIRHRFVDEFELIIGPGLLNPAGGGPSSPSRLQTWARKQRWIFLSPSSSTGQLLARWIKRQNWDVKPAMELDNFEIIIHLVALGLGAALVPRRALAAYPRRNLLTRLPLKHRCQRDIVMLTHRQSTLPKHVRSLIDGVLFS